MTKIEFPKGFYWGTATSSHQVEGGTINNWTKWEKENAEHLANEAKTKWEKWQQQQFPEMFKKGNYISGKAADHYNRFEEDFDIAKSLGHNAHRFSIEWSRIEPEEGKFDEKEIEHYRQVILALKKRGIEPFITLWHWTEPIWFNKIGGWTNKKSQKYFLRFVKKVVESFKNDVKFWIVVNEPNVGLGFGYFRGSQPPGKSGIINFLKAYFNVFAAYRAVYDTVHQINKNAMVGFAHSFSPYQSTLIPPFDKIAVAIAEYLSKYFVDKNSDKFDFIGCNYYSRNLISLKKKFIPKEKITDLGREIYPQGLYQILKSLQKYNKPIYITENGLADAKDKKRAKFIKDHLYWTYKAISEGADVRGYLYWSLLDNFEFPDVRGFWPRFGLVEVDYKTQMRKIRNSALEYKKIIENNGLAP